jgi:hypothetical protein
MSNTQIDVPVPKKRNRDRKGLPKRLNRPGYLARKARYLSERRREKNRARRIVKDALRSSNPKKVAIAQARSSADVRGVNWTLLYVEDLVKGL